MRVSLTSRRHLTNQGTLAKTKSNCIKGKMLQLLHCFLHKGRLLALLTVNYPSLGTLLQEFKMTVS